MTEVPEPESSDWLSPAEPEYASDASQSQVGPEPRSRALGSRPALSGLLAFALVGGGVLGGAVVAHAVWRPSASSSPAGSSAAPGGFSQGPSSGFGNQDPFNGELPGGQFPRGFGSGPNDGVPSTTSDGPTNAAAIAAKVDDAIVDINTTIGYGQGQAAGTGMVLTSTGEVLTNNHVISGATSISVTDVGNGKTYDATVVGYDRSHDVAVLQLKNASGLATITAATSPAQVGAGVVGVGNAGGTGGTPSYAGGVVVDLNRQITATDEGDGTSEQLTGLIETDAGIVAGDSGGPLVNEQGQVVGMDTAASANYRFNQTSDAYAIPIDSAMTVASQIESGQASDTVHIGPTARIGVEVQTADGYTSSGSGAVIAGVLDNGPAQGAGLVTGDVITALDGQPVRSPNDLTRIIVAETPGTTVTIQYLDREGATRTARIQLATGAPQ